MSKVENAKATAAQLWVTGCPGYAINLSGNLEASDNISVLYLLEMIAQGLKNQGG
jgi:Fe-S oxidoreductase